MIRVAVLTISDSCVDGTRTDLSGPAVAERAAALGWQVVHGGVLPDEAERISAELARLADSGAVDVALTSGGTGVAARDVTPEATRAAIEREIPGLAEVMRSEGLKFTRRAALSRAVAGSRGRCLIVNLPGSPKGATTCAEVVLPVLGHAVWVATGQPAH